MASESPDQKKAKRSSKERRLMDSDHKLERLNSLPWNSSLPESNDDSDDPFSLFIGSNELEGGFLALEEIDDSEYVEIPKIEVGNVKKRAVVSLLLQHQFEELARQKIFGPSNIVQNKGQLVVIGQDCVEPLQALRSASKEASLDLKEIAEKHKSMDNLRKKRKEMKKHISIFPSCNFVSTSTVHFILLFLYYDHHFSPKSTWHFCANQVCTSKDESRGES